MNTKALIAVVAAMAIIAAGSFYIGSSNLIPSGFAVFNWGIPSATNGEDAGQATADGSAAAGDANIEEIIAEPKMGGYTLTELTEMSNLNKRFNEMYGIHREKYNLPLEIFENLPAFPEDFGVINYMFRIGRFTDLDYLTEAFYKQPEFYPYFKERALDKWRSPNPDYVTVRGYGTYLADQWVYTKPGEKFTASAFFHVDWGVQTYQGFMLVPAFPSVTADSNGTVIHTQNPVETAKYFEVGFDEQVFLMGPTYPKFDNNWAKKVKMSVLVRPETPKGTYVVGFDVAKPPAERSQDWLTTYKMDYVDGPGFITIGRPQLQLVVAVR